MIILDTDVLSEVMKAAPSPQVIQWLAQYPSPRLFTTTITQAEILYGVGLLPKGKKRTALESAVEAIFAEEFEGRILPFDSEAARAFARIASARRATGRPVTQFDTQIAAIAYARGAAVATRNSIDFEGCGIAVLNPWGDEAQRGMLV
ncbi:MAG TPA: type II toxin-antitoxin system VapC family toxin [Terriglobia bacterium]|nr:type II toxin-antitoxin system VapC family toxin [Terriglobia bacterium]